MAQAITTIRVGDGEVELRRPSSYAAILDVIGVLGRNLPRGYGAAVGACWPAAAPWPGEKQPSARLLAADGLDYGGRVIDDLRAAGMPWSENIIQVGMRSIGSARRREYEEALDWGVKIITARQVHRQGIDQVIDLVPANSRVYVAFDCDSLDSSVMPAVMAPTPGGLTYWDVIDILHGVAARAKFCGINLVEFMPEQDRDGNAALTAARIIFNAAALLARKSKKEDCR